MTSNISIHHGIATSSPKMREFLQLVDRVARAESTVLIRGETGTGKELVARAIHTQSHRSQGPFEAVNCATLTPELLASELFGHVRGAFTGAVRDHTGLFERCDGGIVFLDEIAELPLDLQSRLLRVLEDQSFVPVGGTEPIQVDVRLVTATHDSLRRRVEAGKFRADLMYRIRVVPIFLPKLIERDDDVEALLWHFIEQFNQDPNLRTVETVTTDAMDAIRHYDWPGNVRELRNLVEYAFVVGEGEELSLSHLLPELRGEAPPGPPEPRTATEQERGQILAALRDAGGRKGKAAELLGWNRSTLWRKMREHGL